jgi:hypothetical protein
MHLHTVPACQLQRALLVHRQLPMMSGPIAALLSCNLGVSADLSQRACSMSES